MTSLFQVEEASTGTGKKAAVAIAILAVFGLGLWVGGEMAFRLFISPLRQGL